MASTAAALKAAFGVAMCVMLLHSSIGQQLAPAPALASALAPMLPSDCPPYYCSYNVILFARPEPTMRPGYAIAIRPRSSIIAASRDAVVTAMATPMPPVAAARSTPVPLVAAVTPVPVVAANPALRLLTCHSASACHPKERSTGTA
ncbi:hypothetical protein C2845_PM05G19110 [Panicum miliaceum]|uniref:Uncharacterized protein n=1 Tax=Panicum miliaceum TaxID=4540 RepID=A0A3L6T2U1_PANMI|nr:hypothetical protein C2845_PM05G19110 [Panicum miliaceum]